MSKCFQVVIVGGGPVGMAMAIELGQRGISCAIVERRTLPHRIPKGQGLTQRAMEHFYRWGVADKLRSVRVLPPGFSLSGVTAYLHGREDYKARLILVRPDHYIAWTGNAAPDSAMAVIGKAVARTGTM